VYERQEKLFRGIGSQNEWEHPGSCGDNLQRNSDGRKIMINGQGWARDGGFAESDSTEGTILFIRTLLLFLKGELEREADLG